MEIAFLRYFAAAVPLAIYCMVKSERADGQSLARAWASDLNRVDLRIALVGVLTFFVSPYLQMTGLRQTRAIDGALMVAMEPLFTILTACLVLGERLRISQIGSILVALLGAGILTELSWSRGAVLSEARLAGNLIVLASMFSETAYSVLSKPALERRSPLIFVTGGLVTGTALLFVANVLIDGPRRLAGFAPLVENQRIGDCLAFLYLGLGCTLFGYLYWMVVLAKTPVSLMALTLYVQPVLGIVWGRILLDEPVTASTLIGAGLIVIALWLGSRPQRG